MKEILMGVWAAIGASVIILVKAGIEKLTARIKNVPDAKERRAYNEEEHAAHAARLEAMQASIERLAVVTGENAQLRAACEEKDAVIAKLRKDLSNALKLKEQASRNV